MKIKGTAETRKILKIFGLSGTNVHFPGKYARKKNISIYNIYTWKFSGL